MRTKKNPTPSPAKTIGAGLPNETRKGSGPSVARLEERVARLERLFAYLGEGILRSLPAPLVTDALLEVLGDRDDEASRRAAEALFAALEAGR
jgi:hypothetical protein